MRAVSKNDILNELPKLGPEDRLEILSRIYELDGGTWENDGELSEADKTLLESRLREVEKNSDPGSSWQEVEARIREQLNP